MSFCSEKVKDKRKTSDDSGIVERVFRPVFKSVPQDQAVREGTCVRLDCVISARPIADVTWFKNDQPVQQDSLHKVSWRQQTSVLRTSPQLVLPCFFRLW